MILSVGDTTDQSSMGHTPTGRVVWVPWGRGPRRAHRPCQRGSQGTPSPGAGPRTPVWTLSGFQHLGQGLAWTFGRTSLSPNIKDGSLKCGTSEQHNTLGSVLQAAPPLFLTAFPEASTGPLPRRYCPPVLPSKIFPGPRTAPGTDSAQLRNTDNDTLSPAQRRTPLAHPPRGRTCCLTALALCQAAERQRQGHDQDADHLGLHAGRNLTPLPRRRPRVKAEMRPGSRSYTAGCLLKEGQIPFA